VYNGRPSGVGAPAGRILGRRRGICAIARSLNCMQERNETHADVQRGGAVPEGEAAREEEATARRRGPRGGTTTITDSGMVKKNFWLPGDLAEAVRTMAFEQRRSEAEIFREALERLLAEAE
jgi:hypothetical protein